MAGQWRDVAEFYKGRGAKYGTMSIVSIVVFLGILVAVNYLGTRQNKRWDFTANQVYSLSDQTIKILKDLKEPVQVTVFERNDRQDAHKDRLEEYQYQTDAAQDRVHRSRPRADARRSGEGRVAADDPVRVPGPHRARHVDRTNRTSPTR